MIRRSVLAAGAVAAALALSSCSTFDTNDNAASTGDHELSQDDVRLMVESELGQELLQNTPVDGVIDANSARSLIGVWVVLTALEDAGVLADVDTTSIQSDLEANHAGWTTAPQIMRDLAIKDIQVGTLLQQGDIDAEQLRLIVNASDISVDSRYGHWSDENTTVVGFD